MSYSPFKVERLGGLNLIDDPEEVGFQGAVNSINVDHRSQTLLESRAGYTKLNASAAPSNLTGPLYPVVGSGGTLVIGTDSANIRAFNSTGVLAGSQAVTTTTPLGGVAAQGTPSGIRIYIFTNGVYRTPDGVTFTNLPAVYPARFAAISPTDNRVVQAHTLEAGVEYPSRVRFSAPGDGDTWDPLDKVDLRPGDGASIRDVVTWNNDVYVFKDAHIDVFYGVTTDNVGGAVFNHRTIDVPKARVRANGAVATPDGVYFATSAGLYRTQGGKPEELSGPVRAVLEGKPPTGYYTGPTDFPSDGVAYADGKVFLRSASGALVVYCINTKAWTTWTLAHTVGDMSRAGIDREPGTVGPLLFHTNGTQIYHYKPTLTTDDGTAIAATYQSGFYDLGANEVKVIRETLFEGIGTVTHSLPSDWATSAVNSTSVTLGTTPKPGGGRNRKAYRGRLFSNLVTGSGQWSINRLVHHVRDKRPAGLSS